MVGNFCQIVMIMVFLFSQELRSLLFTVMIKKEAQVNSHFP